MQLKLLTVARMAELSDGAFTEASLRWMLFNAGQNGMDAHRVRIKIGRRVFIDPEAFSRWVDAQQRSRPAPVRAVPAILAQRDKAA